MDFRSLQMLFGFGMMCNAGFATSGFSGGSACAIFFSFFLLTC